jgi:hypothetical protein
MRQGFPPAARESSPAVSANAPAPFRPDHLVAGLADEGFGFFFRPRIRTASWMRLMTTSVMRTPSLPSSLQARASGKPVPIPHNPGLATVIRFIRRTPVSRCGRPGCSGYLLHNGKNSGVGSALERNFWLIGQRSVDSDQVIYGDVAQAILGKKFLAATRKFPRRGLARPIDSGQNDKPTGWRPPPRQPGSSDTLGTSRAARSVS